MMESMIDLTNFADGAVAERFNQELQKVLENLADPNTDPKKARKLQLTLEIKGDERRDIANVSVKTKLTLSPAKDIETKIVMDYDHNGRVTGAELKSGAKGQTRIDIETGEIQEDNGSKIYSFRPSKEEVK